MVVNDQELRFIPLDVHNAPFVHLIFIANSMGYQPIIARYLQSPLPQTVALVGTGVHWVLSESTSGKKSIQVLSQDEY